MNTPPLPPPVSSPKNLLRAFAAFLFCVSATAGAADLWDIYQVALAKDAEYRAARYDYLAARLDYPLARTALRPEISISGFGSLVREETHVSQTQAEQSAALNQPIAAGDFAETRRDNRITLSASMPLFDRTLSLEVNRARLMAGNAKLRFQQAHDNLLLRVAEHYFDLLAARDSKKVARASVLAIGRQRELSSQRLEVGLGTRTDLLDAEARYQQAVVDEIQADNAIANASHALKTIIGYVPAALTPLGENAPLAAPSPRTSAAWVKRALAANLELRIAEMDLKIAEAEAKQIGAAVLPSIVLGANTQQIDAEGNGPDESSSISATVTWNLFQGGALFHKRKQAAHQQNAARQKHEQTRRRIESDAASAYLTAAGNLKQVKALREAVRAGASALRAKEEGFRAGLSTNIDVLDAERDHSDSRSMHLRARYDFILSVLRLEQAAGDLDEKDLQRINKWLGGR